MLAVKYKYRATEDFLGYATAYKMLVPITKFKINRND